MSQASSTDMTQKLHETFGEGMVEAFELITRRKKTSEPVQMADWIREMIRKRRAIFRKEGRSDNWKAMKEKTRNIIEKYRETYNSEMREKFLSAKDPRVFYSYVQALLSENEPTKQNVGMLDPSKSKAEMAKHMANYFNAISSEYQPLDTSTIPETFRADLPSLTEQEVVKKIKKMKKKTSSVPGDISPHLYESYADLLATPITAIFNQITRSKEWPDLWKTEHVTIIPKNSNSTTAEECRNLSCTNFLSKVYESFVLDWARTQVTA